MKWIGADGCRRGWFAVIFDKKISCDLEIFQTIDALWGHHHDAREIIRESHPEICFWAFARGRAMAKSKKTREGQEERLNILSRIYPGVQQIYDKAFKSCERRDVARDDILDSLALALTASEPQDQLSAIPLTPPKDEKGLSMEIVVSKRYLKGRKGQTVPAVFVDERDLASQGNAVITERHGGRDANI